MPRLHSFPNSANLADYSPGLTISHKDDDFDQIGEVLNIPIVGHHLRFVPRFSSSGLQVQLGHLTPHNPITHLYGRSFRTLRQSVPIPNSWPASTGLSSIPKMYQPNPPRPLAVKIRRANTCWLIHRRPVDLDWAEFRAPGTLAGTQNFRTASDFADPRHAHPELPASSRLLDLFTCDGPGFNHDGTEGEYFPDTDPFGQRFDLARGFTARGTRGLLNINTASVESLRALPNWYKSLGVDAYTSVYSQQGAERFPRTWMAEAASSYRDGYSSIFSTHGLPVDRTFFDLRDSIHIVPLTLASD